MHFLGIPNASNWIGKWGKSEELKCQFQQMEGDMDLLEIPKSIPISNKRTPRTKAIMVKDENKKRWKSWEKIYIVILKKTKKQKKKP